MEYRYVYYDRTMEALFSPGSLPSKKGLKLYVDLKGEKCPGSLALNHLPVPYAGLRTQYQYLGTLPCHPLGLQVDTWLGTNGRILGPVCCLALPNTGYQVPRGRHLAVNRLGLWGDPRGSKGGCEQLSLQGGILLSIHQLSPDSPQQ